MIVYRYIIVGMQEFDHLDGRHLEWDLFFTGWQDYGDETGSFINTWLYPWLNQIENELYAMVADHPIIVS